MSGDRLDQLDYYTLLGVDARASTDEIRAAFHAFARKYHPDAYAAKSAAHVARATQIYRRGTEALRVLCQPEARQRYDEGLARGLLRFDPSLEPFAGRPASQRPTPFGTRSPRARPFAAEAQKALAEGDLRTARLNLQLALQYEPDNATLASELEAVEARLKTPAG